MHVYHYRMLQSPIEAFLPLRGLNQLIWTEEMRRAIASETQAVRGKVHWDKMRDGSAKALICREDAVYCHGNN